MGAEPTFVDTNVLVYASRAHAPLYPRAIAGLRQARDEGRPLWLSRQVLREYLAAVTRPQATLQAFSIPRASADVAAFICDFNVAEDGAAVTGKLLELLARYPTGGRQVHDANIVATMLTHGIRRLLTFNAADFRRFACVIYLESLNSP